MDAVIVGAAAGLLGAAVGAGGAIGAAAFAGRHQAKTQKDHWRRQFQRDTHVAFAVAWSNFHRTLIEASDLFRMGAIPAAEQLTSALTLADQQREKASDALSVLQLDGVRAVFMPAWQAHEHLVSLSHLLQSASDPNRRHEAVWAEVSRHVQAARQEYEHFIEAVNETNS
ncbi:hypothetical protein [Streptomyces sp. MZ04]|uniref:hypothetical protein n=1 Tax=Streptomyces sp. MZ04 TaxID=2559236 RepID=UPI00107EAAF4|nr:hypothetical protein [Streptomyces sp. MZ04]TGB16083.1 hypothetical protein E2651_01215 [Streptomyces sp. MZ04]